MQQQRQHGVAPPLPASKPSNQPQNTLSDHLNMPMFELVDIGVLRECLHWEFSDLVGRPGPPGSYGSDLGSSGSDTDTDEAQKKVSNSASDTTGRNGKVFVVQDGSKCVDKPAGNDSSSSIDRENGFGAVLCGATAPVADSSTAAAGDGCGDPANAAAAVASAAPPAINGVAEPISSALVHIAAPKTAEPAPTVDVGLTQARIFSQSSGDDSDSLEGLLSVLNSRSAAVDPGSAQPSAVAATDAVRNSSKTHGSIEKADSNCSKSISTVVQAGSGTPNASGPAATPALTSQTTGDSVAHSDANAAGTTTAMLPDNTPSLPAAAIATANSSAAGSESTQRSAAALANTLGVSSSSSNSKLVLQSRLDLPGAAASSAVSATAGNGSTAPLDAMAYNSNGDNMDPCSVVPAAISMATEARIAKQGSVYGSTATTTGSTPAVGVKSRTRAPRTRGKAGLTFENLLDDIVVLTFLVRCRKAYSVAQPLVGQISRVPLL